MYGLVRPNPKNGMKTIEVILFVDLDVIAKKADVTSQVQLHHLVGTGVTIADGCNLH